MPPAAPRLWTPQQTRAVELFGSDLLVSASAGTGKTAVLAERILRLVADPASEVGVDRLLVVTFTRAAAAEMRRRIAEGLRALAGPDPVGRHAARQLVLLDRADVGTLHSFCRDVVRGGFRDLGLDPASRILDADEARRLRAATAAEVFESAYADPGETGRAFHELADLYGARLGDDNLIDTVLRLDERLSAEPDPDRLLAEARRAAEPPPPDGPLPGEPAFRAMLYRELTRLSAMTGRALDFVLAHPAAATAGEYLLRLSGDLEGLRSAVAAGDVDAATGALHGFDPGRRPALAVPDGADDAVRAVVESARRRLAELRERLARLAEKFGGYTAVRIRRDLAAVSGPATALLGAVERFRAAYAAAKSARRALDFSDLERQALRLLGGPDGPETPAGRRLRDKYEHVLVDEYQDISPLQDAVIRRLSRPGRRFLVGDVKQSIYGFRQADPGLFLQMLAAFAPADKPVTTAVPGRRAELTGNFRSRAEVIAGVNALMERLMVSGLGGPAYDDSARLTAAAPPTMVPEGLPPLKPQAVELNLIDHDPPRRDFADDEPDGRFDDELSPAEAAGVEAEARWVAARIAAMVRGREFSVTGPDGPRPVGFGDVVILLRGLRGRAEAYAEALAAAGVPAAAVRGGWARSVEFRDVLNLLHVLDNPRRDAELLGVLRSPLLGFADAELAEIRTAAPDGDWLSALEAAASSPPASAGLRVPAAKAADALRRIDDWRTDYRRGSAGDALARVFRETGYPGYVAGLPGGARRRADLLALLDRVRRLERRPDAAGSVADALEDADDADSDIGPEPESAAGDAVRILSIHRSKGLEFPVVFVPDLARRFHLRDLEGDFLYSRRLGLGLTAVDRTARTRTPTLPHLLIADERRGETLAEELRLLYVALTRARDGLVLSAAASRERDLPRWERFAGHSGPLPDDVLAAARGPADWVFPAALCGGDGAPAMRVVSAVGGADAGGPSSSPAPEPAPTGGEGARPPDDPQSREVDALVNRLTWTYAHPRLAGIAASRSVTSLREAGAPRRTAPAARPKFLLDGPTGPEPAEVGAAVHLLMRRIDLAGPADAPAFAALRDRLVGAGLIAPAVAERIDPGRLAAFFATEPGRWMRAHPADVRREVPVVFTLPAGEIEPALAGADAAEPVVINGRLDVLADYRGGFWLVDYKTDAVTAEQVLAATEAHRRQLELYRRAVAAIWGRPVVRTTVAFLSVPACIDVR